MSTTIDQRVVEMQFDNRHFEQNVKTSMSTLDKLKQSLNLTGAAKGFDDVSAAAKRVDMKGLSDGVDTVRQRFSALEVMGVTALANITNSAVNAGKRMLSALTIDPIKTGFSEYELKMDSIKTIMASTGESVDTVNKYLNELNEYSDQTIYSFADMTQNIGKFTNAGVKLEDAVLAIKGISNEAAVSGANANEASRAMYNFAQALSAGYVKLIDWKSIENANMATVEFKQQLIDTAVELDVVKESADGMYTTLSGKSFNATKNFNEVLQEQWMTTDVLVKTLGKYADANTDIGKKAFAAAQDVTKLTQVWDILKETAQSGWARTWELIVGDIEQAKAILTPLTNTLSEIINGWSDARNNVLEELLGSKWSKLTTKITAAGVSQEEFEKRSRKALEAAGYDVDELLKKYGSFEKIFKSIPNGINILKNALHGLVNGANGVVDKLFDITGINRLLGWGAVGDDVKKVQDALVKLGYTLDKFGVDGIIGPETTAAIKAFQEFANIKVDGVVGPETLAALEKLNGTTKEIVDENGELVISYEDLQAALTKKSGRELLVESLQNVGNGLLGIFKALKEAWEAIFPPKSVEEKAAGLYKILETINEFTQKLRLTEEVTGENGEVIKQLNDNGKKLVRTFKGIFAVLKLVADFVGGIFRFAFKVVSGVLEHFNINILDITAVIGDALVAFSEWFDSAFGIKSLVEALIPYIESFVAAIKEWWGAFQDTETYKKISEWLGNIVQWFKDLFSVDTEGLNWATVFAAIASAVSYCAEKVKALWEAFKGSAAFQKVMEFFKNSAKNIREWFDGFKNAEDLPKHIFDGIAKGLKTAWESLKSAVGWLGNYILEQIKKIPGVSEWFAGLEDAENIPQYIIEGLIKGLAEGITWVWDAATELASNLVQAVKDFLGIHSPSTVFIEIGKYIIDGLIAGIRYGVSKILEVFGAVINPVLDWLKSLDLSPVFSILIGAGGLWFLKQVGEVIGGISAVLSGFEDITAAVRKVGKALSTALYAEAAKSFATAILILVAAIAILTLLDMGKMWSAVGAIVVIIAALAGVIIAMNLTLKENSLGGIAKFAGLILAVSGAIMIMAIAVAILNGIPWGDGIAKFGVVLGAFAIVIGALIGISFLMAKNVGALSSFAVLSESIFQVALGIGILAIALRIIGGMSMESIWQATGVLAAIGGLVVAMMLVIQLISLIPGSTITSFGSTMLSIGGAFLMLAITMRMLGGMSEESMNKAFGALWMIAGVIAVLMAVIQLVSMIPGNTITTFGSTMLGIGGAFLLLAITMHILAALSDDNFGKAVGALWILVGVIGVLAVIAKVLSPAQAVKLGGTIMALAGAIAILALVALLLSYVDPDGIWNGVLIVAALSVLMAGLIFVTKYANDVKGTLIAMVVGIAVLATAIGVLTLCDPKKLMGATVAMGIVMGIFALVIKATKGVKGCMSTLIVLTVAIAVIAGILIAMSSLDINDALPNALALAIVMLAMTKALQVASKIGNKAKKAYPAILALTAMVVPLVAFAAALKLIEVMNISPSIIPVIGIIAAVMAAMVLLLIPLSAMGKLAGFNMLTGVLALTTMVVALVAFAGAIKLIEMMRIDMSVASTILMLAQVMTAMTVLLAALAVIGTLASWGSLVGVLALTAMVVPLVAFAGAIWLIGKMNIGGVMPVIAQLTAIMGALTIMLAIAAVVAPMTIPAISALTAMAGVLGVFGVVAGALGALMEWFPELRKFVGTGIDLLIEVSEGLGKALGSFIGNMVGTAIEGAADAIISFIEDLAVAFETLSGVDMSNASDIKALAEALLLITGAELLDQLSKFIFGDEGGFGDQLGALADGMKTFADKSANIDQDALQNGINALLALVEATKQVPDQDWYVKLFPWGRGDEAVFGEGLAALGAGINGFATSCADIDASKVAGGIDALKALIAASETVPDAAWYEKIIPWGGDDNAVFGAGLASLGTGIASFAGSCGAIDPNAVSTGCDALKALIEASKDIPDATWYEKIVPWSNGDEEMFGKGLTALGEGVAGFASKCNGIDADAVTAGVSALVALVAASKEIPDASWYEKLLWGDSDEEVFGNSLKTLGSGVAAFYEAINGVDFDAAKMESMTSALTAAVKIANSGKISEETAKTWKTALTNLGDGLYNFYTKGKSIITEDLVDGVDEVFKSVKAVTDMIKTTDVSGTYNNLELLTKALNNLLNVDASSQTITDAINKIAKIDGKALADACKSIVEGMGTLAEDMIDAFATSVDNNLSTATDACTEMAEACVEAIKGVDFSSAGKACVTGFAKGIELNHWISNQAAKSMANAAKNTAKQTLNINSPSKVFRAIGYSVPEGFAQGIDRMTGLVKGSAKSMAQASIDSVKGSIARLADAVNADIDTQPTIRPVLDLSDVRMGAGIIDGLLNNGTALGVTANVNSINSMMNRRIQNGVNGDVVSAIEKLNKNLGNVGNTTYTIDGITYDDGTNISNAVKELVRAARIERRV